MNVLLIFISTTVNELLNSTNGHSSISHSASNNDTLVNISNRSVENDPRAYLMLHLIYAGVNMDMSGTKLIF